MCKKLGIYWPMNTLALKSAVGLGKERKLSLPCGLPHTPANLSTSYLRYCTLPFWAILPYCHAAILQEWNYTILRTAMCNATMLHWCLLEPYTPSAPNTERRPGAEVEDRFSMTGQAGKVTAQKPTTVVGPEGSNARANNGTSTVPSRQHEPDNIKDFKLP